MDSEQIHERALAASKEVLQRLPLDSMGPSKEAIGAVLSTLAGAGLMDFGFLNSSTKVSANDMRQAVAIMEALASQSGSLASIYLVNAIMAGSCVAAAGTVEQRNEILPQLRSGSIQIAFALTEPEAGSDAASLTTTADRDSNAFRLTGEKLFATGAATADMIIVVARTNGSTDKRAFGLFLIAGDAQGLTIEPLEEKLAARVHASCRIRLDNVVVSDQNVLGGLTQIGKAWTVLRYMGTLERLAVAALALGLASAIVKRAVSFARERQQFGQPISSFQAIQHTLVEMRTIEIEMRLFVEHALAAYEAGGANAEETTQAVCMAKWICAEQLQQIVAKGMRVMGGRAYFGELDGMERFYREAPFSLYAGGTIEIQKMLIARTMGLTDPAS
jgi:alkylation response protein AidB-like acyl-CoA dehydrogenase